MNKLRWFVYLLALTGLLAACSPSSQPQTAKPTDTVPTMAQVEPSATTAPSPTPEQGRVVLVAPEGTDAKPFQALLSELSGPSGWALDTRPAVQPGDLTPSVRVVVLAAAPANLNDLRNAAPQAQFVVVSDVDLPQANNLTVIRQRLENQAFIGGFISVLLSQDYRAAGLLPADGPLGDSLKEAYTNGGHYFCGVCAPGWPLAVYYPLPLTLPGGSDGTAWQQTAANAFDNQKVEVYYLTPEALKPELTGYLQGRTQFEKAVALIGTMNPPDALKSQWAATIHFDLPAALRQAWPEIAAGKGGMAVDAPLLVDNVNPENLGEGRMRLVKELMEEINSGTVYPLTVPAQ